VLSTAAGSTDVEKPRRLGSGDDYRHDVAIAMIGGYPGAEPNQVMGVVVTEDAEGGGVIFSGELVFPDQKYVGLAGGVHVHAGFTCEDALEVYYHFCPWKGADATDDPNCNLSACGPYSCHAGEFPNTDPWNTLYTPEKGQNGKAFAIFSALIKGEVDSKSKKVFSVDGGKKSPDTYGTVKHAVVVHEPIGSGGGPRIGCGILELKRKQGTYKNRGDNDYS